jgi:hypothetical protein
MIDQLLEIQRELLADAQENRPRTVREFTLRAYVTALRNYFFDADAPVFESTKEGSAGKEIMRWAATLTDASGDVSATFWDKPCFELFEVAAARLREYWETGVEEPSKQVDILAALNKNLSKEMLCVCSAEVRTFGQKNVKHETQLNVNVVELLDASA